MTILWYGLSCLRCEIKTPQGEIVLVTDPFDPKREGLTLPRAIKTDIVVQSFSYTVPISLEPTEEGKQVFVVDRAGEYEKGGVFIRGMRVSSGTDHRVYIIEAEDMRMLWCGPLAGSFSEKEFEEIENIDIMYVPVGGHGVLTAKDALGLVQEIEPRVVIPLHYMVPEQKNPLDGLDPFVKGMGAKQIEPQQKVKLSKKELPSEETRVIVLTPPL